MHTSTCRVDGRSRGPDAPQGTIARGAPEATGVATAKKKKMGVPASGVDAFVRAMQRVSAPIRPKPSKKARAQRAPRPVAVSTPNTKSLTVLYTLTDQFAKYHRYEVHGLDKLPKDGRYLVAFTHSLATYDIALFMREHAKHRGRDLRMLADHLIFNTPGLGVFARGCGLVDGYPENANWLLQNDAPVGVAPGGMREALRPSSRAFEVEWARHKGFVRTALLNQTPIYLAACPAADKLYYVYGSKLTDLLLKAAHVPVPVATGRGLTPMPEGVKLDHYVSDAIVPKALPRSDMKKGDPDFEAMVDELHAEVMTEMRHMLAEHRPMAMPRPSNPVQEARSLVGAGSWLAARGWSMARSGLQHVGHAVRSSAKLG